MALEDFFYLVNVTCPRVNCYRDYFCKFLGRQLCLISLNMTLSRSTHIAANDIISLFLMARQLNGHWLGWTLRVGMDREAWHAVVHGVTKSRTWLSDWTELNGWVIFHHVYVPLHICKSSLSSPLSMDLSEVSQTEKEKYRMTSLLCRI